MTDIPKGYDLTGPQLHQIKLTKKKGDDIFKPAIEAELKDFKFPLYFLDYETISSPIPLFDGTKPGSMKAGSRLPSSRIGRPKSRPRALGLNSRCTSLM